MEELPHWCVYARLQSQLTTRSQIDDYAWGLEAGLNRLLSEKSSTEDDVERAIHSESRRQRYRTALRRLYSSSSNHACSPENAADARQRLRLIKGRVTAEEWTILRAVGTGLKHNEIAAEQRKAPGAIRVQLLRLRRSLRASAG